VPSDDYTYEQKEIKNKLIGTINNADFITSWDLKPPDAESGKSYLVIGFYK